MATPCPSPATSASTARLGASQSRARPTHTAPCPRQRLSRSAVRIHGRGVVWGPLRRLAVADIYRLCPLLHPSPSLPPSLCSAVPGWLVLQCDGHRGACILPVPGGLLLPFWHDDTHPVLGWHVPCGHWWRVCRLMRECLGQQDCVRLASPSRLHTPLCAPLLLQSTCPGGFYCETGSISPFPCDAGWSCPPGSANETQCRGYAMLLGSDLRILCSRPHLLIMSCVLAGATTAARRQASLQTAPRPTTAPQARRRLSCEQPQQQRGVYLSRLTTPSFAPRTAAAPSGRSAPRTLSTRLRALRGPTRPQTRPRSHEASSRRRATIASLATTRRLAT
jgi:hypothetical protein